MILIVKSVFKILVVFHTDRKYSEKSHELLSKYNFLSFEEFNGCKSGLIV